MVQSVEGHSAVDHRVQQHAKGPGVHLRAPVRPPVDDLRGGVKGAATEGLQELVTVVDVGQAKVCDLEDNNNTSQCRLLQHYIDGHRVCHSLRPNQSMQDSLQEENIL